MGLKVNTNLIKGSDEGSFTLRLYYAARWRKWASQILPRYLLHPRLKWGVAQVPDLYTIGWKSKVFTQSGSIYLKMNQPDGMRVAALTMRAQLLPNLGFFFSFFNALVTVCLTRIFPPDKLFMNTVWDLRWSEQLTIIRGELYLAPLSKEWGGGEKKSPFIEDVFVGFQGLFVGIDSWKDPSD